MMGASFTLLLAIALPLPFAPTLPISAASTAESGAEVLPLDEAIRMALRRTRDVIRARLDLDLSEVERTRARSFILPSLEVLLSMTEVFAGTPVTEARRAIPAPAVPEEPTAEVLEIPIGPFQDYRSPSSSQPDLRLTLSARQPLYDGGRWWTLISRAEDLRRAREAALVAVENDTRLVVVRRFYDLEKARRSVATFRLQITRDEEQLERARLSLKDGNGKQNDVSTAERNLAEDRVVLARLRFNDSNARRFLNLALGREARTEVRLVLPREVSTTTSALGAISIPPREELLTAALEVRPELVSARAILEVVRRNVTIREAEYWPNLSLGASYSRGSRRPDRVFDDPSENYRASLDLTFRWNLFSGRAHSANVQESEIELAKAEVSYVDQERLVAGEVEEKVERLFLLIDTFNLARDAARSAEEASRTTRSLYTQGKATALELRDAESKLTQSNVAAFDSRLDLEVAREELRRAVGQDVVGSKGGG